MTDYYDCSDYEYDSVVAIRDLYTILHQVAGRTPPEEIWWSLTPNWVDIAIQKPHIQKALLSGHKVVHCPIHKTVICKGTETECPVRNPYHNRCCNKELTWKESTT